jgi:hypothetical protein
MTVFSIAAMTVISSGTAASADNRARITAAGLAQRELDYASEIITSSPGGAGELLSNGGKGPDSQPPKGTETRDPDFPISIDGQRYRVVREAAPYDNGVSSPCVNPNPDQLSAQPAMGISVTVTVTWEGMSGGARPQVATKIFPPRHEAATGLDPGQAQLVVFVEGRDNATDPAGPVLGVEVAVDGPNVQTAPHSTNTAGCAVFLVAPDAAGSDYKVELKGYRGSSDYVDAENKINPVKLEAVKPGESKPFAFVSYSRAASLTVDVAGGADGLSVKVRAANNLEEEKRVAAGRVVFGGLAPGSWEVWIGDDVYATYELSPGEDRSETVRLIP